MRTSGRVRAAVLMLATGLVPAWSQTGSGSVSGQVTDPSGKSIPDASVSLTGERGSSRSVKSDVRGQYQLRGINPGTYTIRATAKGFAAAERVGYEVKGGPAQVLDLSLIHIRRCRRIERS